MNDVILDIVAKLYYIQSQWIDSGFAYSVHLSVLLCGSGIHLSSQAGPRQAGVSVLCSSRTFSQKHVGVGV